MCITLNDNGFIDCVILKGLKNMTTSIAANANVQSQPQVQACPVIPDFKPSYNAVQLNLSQPTLNVPQMMPPAPETASKEWTA